MLTVICIYTRICTHIHLTLYITSPKVPNVTQCSMYLLFYDTCCPRKEQGSIKFDISVPPELLERG